MKAFRTRLSAVSLCRALGFRVLDANGFPIAVFDDTNEELVRTKNMNAPNEPLFDLPNPELLKEYEEQIPIELTNDEISRDRAEDLKYERARDKRILEA